MGKGYAPDRQRQAIARYAEDDGLVELVGNSKPEPSLCDESLRRRRQQRLLHFLAPRSRNPKRSDNSSSSYSERAWLDKRPRRRRPAKTRFRALPPAAPAQNRCKKRCVKSGATGVESVDLHLTRSRSARESSTRSRLPPATRRARSTTTSLPRKSCFSPWSRGLGTGRGRSRGTCSDSGEAAAAGTARRLLQLGRRTRRARGIAVRARSTREPLRGRTGWCRPDSAPSCTPGRPDAWRASVANDGASDRRAAALAAGHSAQVPRA
jgi:hypothetical protein